MSRKPLHPLFILLLVLGLAGVGAASFPRVARADLDPTTDPHTGGSGGDTGIGDPDAPGTSGLPKPGANRGAAPHFRNRPLAGMPVLGAKGWMFSFRSVFGVWYRAFLRF